MNFKEMPNTSKNEDCLKKAMKGSPTKIHNKLKLGVTKKRAS